MGCAGGSFICDQLDRPIGLAFQKFFEARLSLLKHVDFLWYIFSSRWRVVIREASNPPWAGRRGGYCLAAPRIAAAVLGWTGCLVREYWRCRFLTGARVAGSWAELGADAEGRESGRVG